MGSLAPSSFMTPWGVMYTGRFLLFMDWMRTAAARGVVSKRKPSRGAESESDFVMPASQEGRVADWPLSTRRWGVASLIFAGRSG